MKSLLAILVCAILGATGYGALASSSPFPIAVSVTGYEHGQGVVFAPAGAHYSIRFTATPQVVHSVTHAKGYDIATRSALVSTDDYDMLLREDTISFQGKDRAAAHKAEVRLTQPTMQTALAVVLRRANIEDPKPVGAKVSGYPALVYRAKPTPLNGNVAAAAIYAKGRILTMMVHTDSNGDALLRAFEKSLHFSKG